MNRFPNICKLLDVLELQSFISRSANSVIKDFLLGKFKTINDIRPVDVDSVCAEITKYHGSNEILDDSWLTGEFKEKASEIIATVAVAEAFTKMDIKSHATSLKLLILIHDRLMFTKAS